MKYDVTTKDTGVLQVIEDHSLGEIIKPLVNEIHLFDTFIAGTSFIADQSLFENIKVDERLKLQREHNRFDETAIMILNENDMKLGYIPEKDSNIFARLMDAGKLLIAKVTKIEKHNGLYQISIGIYLIDF